MHMHMSAPKPLHVDYERPPLSFALRVMGCIPRPVRMKLLAAAAKPTPPRDVADVEPGEDPTTILEIVPGKVWRVRYYFLTDPNFVDQLTVIGVDLLDPRVPEVDREQLGKRLAARRAGEREALNGGAVNSQDMIVVRLDDSGELLLYNPCRLRGQVVKWLASLGEVGWIVSGASSHTNQIPLAALAYLVEMTRDHPRSRVSSFNH